MGLQDKRVLVVEDNWLVGDEVRLLIEREGARIFGPLPSAASALKAASQETLDGALLDVQLRDGSALPIASVLRIRKVPFIVMSGFDRSQVPYPMRRAPFVAKPIVGQVLIEAANREFARPCAEEHAVSPNPRRRLASQLCVELLALTGESGGWVMLDLFPRRLRQSWRDIEAAARLAEKEGWLVRLADTVRLTPDGRSQALDWMEQCAEPTSSTAA
jgi:CheY-like chemotaxis protein